VAVAHLGRLALRAAVSLALLLAVLWAAAALWIDGPESRPLAGALSLGFIAIAGLAAMLVRPWWRASVAILVALAIVLAWWLTLAPRNDREWQPDVARLPTATVDGSLLTIRNVRHFEYRAEGDAKERWETRTYDLDTLVGSDVFISFWGPTLYGHTIVSWEFADGRHLAVSIETRKETGEEYSALRGFFRQYELYYVVADERDVIGLRTNLRGETVQLYRPRGTADEGRALLLDYVKEINALAEQPRWYNALTQNCTTTIWLHTKAVGSGPRFDWRLLANGYLPDLAYERRTIDTSIGLEELKRRSDVTARARAAGAMDDFSRVIRDGLPSRPAGGPANRPKPAP
jgi:hypothetical protein